MYYIKEVKENTATTSNKNMNIKDVAKDSILTIALNGNTISEVLNQFEVNFSSVFNFVVTKIESGHSEIEIIESLSRTCDICDLKRMNDFLTASFEVAGLDTPKRNFKLSLTNWITKVLLSAYEILEASNVKALTPQSESQPSQPEPIAGYVVAVYHSYSCPNRENDEPKYFSLDKWRETVKQDYQPIADDCSCLTSWNMTLERMTITAICCNLPETTKQLLQSQTQAQPDALEADALEAERKQAYAQYTVSWQEMDALEAKLTAKRKESKELGEKLEEIKAKIESKRLEKARAITPPKVNKITLTRAEGTNSECKEPVTVKVKTFAAADKVLRQWARTAPDDGAYDKCDITLNLASGNIHKTRFDLMRSYLDNFSSNHLQEQLEKQFNTKLSSSDASIWCGW